MRFSGYSIRDFQAADMPGMLELWQATDLGNANRGDNLEIIQNTLQNGGRLLLVIQNETNKVIGSSWITNDHRRLYLHHFGILPQYQGKGFGKWLCIESLKWARTVGLQIKLEVHINNQKALALYKSLGFGFLGDYDVYIIRDYKNLNF